MNIAAIRTVLVYLTKPEDTSAGGQSSHGPVENLPEKTLRRFNMVKTCLWVSLAVIISIIISNNC